jgi:hypothetical protein
MREQVHMQIHTRVWNYNKMNDDDGGEDRCQSNHDPSSRGERFPSVSFPSRSLSKVTFRGFSVVLYVRSLI